MFALVHAICFSVSYRLSASPSKKTAKQSTRLAATLIRRAQDQAGVSRGTRPMETVESVFLMFRVFGFVFAREKMDVRKKTELRVERK